MKTPEQKAEHAAKMREWRRNNPDAVRAIQKRSREKHRDKRNAATKLWHAENQDRIKAYRRDYAIRGRMLRRLRDYGLTQDEYDRLHVSQEGRCAICREAEGTRQLQVDHNHVTGEVRGLLCWSCNYALGHMKTPEVCESAARYLQERGYYKRKVTP